MPSGGAHLRSFRAYARQMVLGGLRRLARTARPVLRVGVGVDSLFKDRRFSSAVHRAATAQDSDIVVSFLRHTNIVVLAGMARSAIPVLVSERSHTFAYHDLDPLRRTLRPILHPRAERHVVLTAEIDASEERKWALHTPQDIPHAPPT